jgi:hypothetical protein
MAQRGALVRLRVHGGDGWRLLCFRRGHGRRTETTSHRWRGDRRVPSESSLREPCGAAGFGAVRAESTPPGPRRVIYRSRGDGDNRCACAPGSSFSGYGGSRRLRGSARVPPALSYSLTLLPRS